MGVDGTTVASAAGVFGSSNLSIVVVVVIDRNSSARSRPSSAVDAVSGASGAVGADVAGDGFSIFRCGSVFSRLNGRWDNPLRFSHSRGSRQHLCELRTEVGMLGLRCVASAKKRTMDGPDLFLLRSHPAFRIDRVKRQKFPFFGHGQTLRRISSMVRHGNHGKKMAKRDSSTLCRGQLTPSTLQRRSANRDCRSRRSHIYSDAKDSPVVRAYVRKIGLGSNVANRDS